MTGQGQAAAAEPSEPRGLAQILINGLGEAGLPLGIAAFMAVVIFAAVTAILHVRERNAWTRREAETRAEMARLRAEADRAELLLAAEPQVIIGFDGDGGEPVVEGDVARITGGGKGRRVLAFGTWLPPDQARAMEKAVAALRSNGQGFLDTVRTSTGDHVEIEGRAVAGRAVLRLKDVGPERNVRMKLEEALAGVGAELAALKAMLDVAPYPVWLRDRQRRIGWVNRAYAAAVEAPSADAVAEKGLELLDAKQRQEAELSLAEGKTWRARVPAVIGGRRALIDVVDAATAVGSSGIAVDMSELRELRSDLERQMQAHTATLERLPTAVAIFDRNQRLVYHNQAYRECWALDATFLESQPTDGEILERLRIERRLPEQADFKSWKAGILDSYRAVEGRDFWWHLPDRRVLHVVVNPNPQGGVTYLFDDTSEDFHLRSRYEALSRVQRETLDTLHEGVAAFGPDGRLRLFNAAFATMWKLPEDVLDLKPHVDDVIKLARILAPDEEFWAGLSSAIAGLHEKRIGSKHRLTRRDGSVIDCAVAPLPDGSALISFADVTADVKVERALIDRNEALERAARLRDDFIHHVSYELRSPLTTIIGFTQLLGDSRVGPLNDKQSEYASLILRSSAALLVMVNDILDLASIDVGALELRFGPVDLRKTVDSAVEGVQDRLAEEDLRLVIDIDARIDAIVADGKRVRQMLFSLLSNAIGFSAKGQTITVTARALGEKDVVIAVADQGRGIPPEVKDRIFDRFASFTRGSRHRGVGLGLSIVRAFVEAHGGRVTVDSEPGRGTVVACVMPREPAAPAPAEAAPSLPPPQPTSPVIDGERSA